jgi:8-oxo-dGTP pyrophosphatase MutT (NUDIX family)
MSGQQLIGAIGIIRHPDAPEEILVSRRHTDGGLYQFCGGTVEFGEDPVETLRREIREEVGIEVVQVAEWPIVVSLMMGENHILALNYECTAATIEIPPNPEPEFHTDWVWVDEDEFCTMPMFGSSQVLVQNGYFE